VGLSQGIVRGAAGTPEIPELVLRVAIPAGESVLSVEVEAVETRVLGPGLRVSAVPMVSEGGMSVPWTGAAWEGTDRFEPELSGSSRTSGYREGYRIESVVVSPIGYRGTTGELRVCERFVVRVQVGPSPGVEEALVRRRAPRTPRSEREARVRASVDWMVPLGSWGLESERARGDGSEVSERPSLEGSGVDLVIVTPEDLAPSFATLAAWKTSTGLRTEVRTLEWVVSTYEAADVPARIRAFLRDAYVHWGIEYAILGGDTEVLPIGYALSRYQTDAAGALIACDYYMACLDGDWNADGDHLLGEGPRAGFTDDLADLEPDI
jgi:hypothetical protein